MNVTLLTHTPEPERLAACAAKLCYASSDIDTLMDGLTDEKVAGFLDVLTQLGHESPIEHISFTFGIEGVSRSLLAQITRHRIASYSVQSQRYVREGAFEFVVPPEIAAAPAALDLYLEIMRRDQEAYDKISAILKDKHTKELMESGKSEKAALRVAEKLAIEDARFVLPNACHTKMIVTMNARSLYNFFAHRCCERAQWEIRALADAMLFEVKKVAPKLFATSGPPCVRGDCPEGRMSCGKMAEKRERYKWAD